MTLTESLVIAADHPSLDGQIETFLADLRSESRYFGPTARCNPKPFPSLIASLEQRGAFRLARMEGDRVVGLVRIDGVGTVFMAVAADHRGQGIGSSLLATALERAERLGYRRLVMRTTRRSRVVRRVAERLGCTVVDRERGRTDLILPLARRLGVERPA